MLKHTQYAVNLADVTGKDRGPVPGILLAPVIGGKRTFKVRPRAVDGMGVLLECDEKRALAIIEVLRKGFKRRGLSGPRAYSSTTLRSWKVVP